jgi:dienelactone hydrolase
MASEWVSILVDGQDTRAYVSQPETTGSAPGVIVVMEAFGVNKHIQEVTDKLSKEGYAVAAPVLYYRLGSNPLFSHTSEGAEARTRAMGSLRDADLVRDLNATIAYLKGHPQLRADRSGGVGFCVGGRILIPFGEGPAPFERTANIQCPVMGNFGEPDQNPTPDEARQIEAELKRHGKACDFKIYPAPTTALTAMSAQAMMPGLRKTPGQGPSGGSRNTCKPRRCSVWEAKPLQMSLAWLYSSRP